ncbi:MAG: excinuclease ABC subunit UvrC [Bacteroidales bacterium]|nr:excinuclease ABC subunit UvrC [Bacteroidales bacterium]
MLEKDYLANLVSKLPRKPGVYQFINTAGEIIYIGKAKNLKNRVSSYFSSTETGNYKLGALLRKIHDIRYILVENESDALLLENNLIKEYQPRYNILLKDDKTYPWIVVRKESFPRVYMTRNYSEDGSVYYGPYTSGLMVKTLLELIRQLFKLRNCNYLLSQKNIESRKFKRCLEFHMGNCLAPCEGLQSEEEYEQSIQQIHEILKGQMHTVIRYLKNKMALFSAQLLFEQAELVKNKIEILERFQGKSTIVNPKIKDMDVFSMVDEDDFAYVNFLKIVNGAIVQAHNTEVVKKLSEDKSEVLGTVIFDLRTRFKSTANEIIVPFIPDIVIDGVRCTVPVRGDKKRVLDLSFRNATSYKADKQALRSKEKWTAKEDQVLIKLKEDLRMKNLPARIECFDNSNIQGTEPVASCVVFINGKPHKKSYRHFNIKTVSGPNDFASMEEVVGRRYRRMLDENQPLPDLIIIDGGKGQLHAAVKSLKSIGVYEKVAIIGIAKRLVEIYQPEDSVPLYLDKSSGSLRLIQKIRDEAHRFGITFHRKKRSKTQLHSQILDIKGIGQATLKKLQQAGVGMSELKQMEAGELCNIVGERATKMIQNYLKST